MPARRRCPRRPELDHWFGGVRNPQVDADQQLAHLHRVTPRRSEWNELQVMAFDHRSQFFALAQHAGASQGKIPALKRLLLRAAEQVEASEHLQDRIGVLIDGGDYGADALAAATGRGWWVGRPVELPGSRPLRFRRYLSIGSSTVQSWPAEQVCKCLLHYHPDDATALRIEQELKVQELWQATRASGHELLLEIICPSLPTPAASGDAAVLRASRAHVQPGHPAAVVETGTDGGRRVGHACAADRCAGPLVPGCRDPGIEPADSGAGREFHASPSTRSSRVSWSDAACGPIRRCAGCAKNVTIRRWWTPWRTISAPCRRPGQSATQRWQTSVTEPHPHPTSAP